MIPLHPYLVHFPVVLLVAAAGLYVAHLVTRRELIGTMALIFHGLGLMACLAAIFSGDFEADKLSGQAALQPLISQHEQWVTLTTYGFGLLAIWAFLRQKSTLLPERIAFVVLFLGLNVTLGIGAHKGGEMVYVHGAGVMQAPNHFPALQDSTPTLQP